MIFSSFLQIYRFFSKIILTLQSLRKDSGEMLEWLKRHAWKACILPKGIRGSNPRLSAEEKKNPCQVHLSADSSFLLHRPAAGGRGCASIASKSPRDSNASPRGCASIASKSPRDNKDHAIKKYLSRTPCPQHLVLRGNVRQGNKMPPDAHQHAFQVPVDIHRVTDFSASINYK